MSGGGWTVGERVHAVGTVARLDEQGRPIVSWDRGDTAGTVVRHGEVSA